MTDTPRTSDSDASVHVEHTPEEVAAFEARAETLGQYADLMAADMNAERDAAGERLEAAAEAGASESELRGMRTREKNRLNLLLYALLAVVAALIVAYLLFYNGGTDTLAGIDDTASEIAEIAPPEPAATPEEVLPAQVFTYACPDCGATEVTQVPIELSQNATYQFAYEADGARLAIFTVMDAAQYDPMVSAFVSAVSGDVEAPVELDGVGDAAVIFQGSVIFKTSEDCGIISALPKQDAVGEQSMSLSDEELERLARIAAPRM